MKSNDKLIDHTAICPYCQNSTHVKKHGVRNGIQRYFCNTCKRAFQLLKKRIKYSANEKTLLALLVSILQAEKGVPQDETLNHVNENLQNIDEYRILERELPSYDEIKCLNPRLLICESNKVITYYKLNPESWIKNSIKIKDGRIRR